ncbi:MAG TPA: LPS-assembly protein LptD [Acidiferrobacteraceae bacterium]|nr:LPS-assembly protein LptD [Acidiferrobacteraceae bacterium]HEX19584.1 LPS-assembly protein LptD [Acidiferrobacteraceae bacterium]
MPPFISFRTMRTPLLCLILLSPVISLATENKTQPGHKVQCLAPAPVVDDTGKTNIDKTSIPTKVTAGSIEIEKNKHYLLGGGVEISRAGDRIVTDSIRYDKETDTVMGVGTILFETRAGDRFETEALQLQLKDHKGKAGKTRYLINSNPQARGQARVIEFIKPGVMRLKRLRYTTCPKNKETWYLSMRDLKIDKNKGFARAKHVTLRFKKVPIFYFPYLSFPINDQRKSGLLLPRFGRSDRLGTRLEVPYYWNISPQYDATFTPRYLSKRGNQLQTEFRYLDTNTKGQISYEFLDNDKITKSDRGAGYWKHAQSFSPYWSAQVDIRRVSDDEYLGDFGDTLSISSQTHLASSAKLGFRGSVWQFSTRLSTYQTIDSTISVNDEPYDRLPQILLSADKSIAKGHLRFGFDSEWVDFEHKTNLTGNRLNVQPYFSLPFRNSYGFIIPKLSAKYISYELDRASNRKPDFSVSIFSLDTGLKFERDTSIGKRNIIQTLEPRLFYLHVPFENQDTLPLFDTSLPDFNFNTLFRENRFVGGDRMGDTDQATLALTSRFLDANSGVEYFRVSIGQIYVFEDQRVNLPAATKKRGNSDIILETAARLPGNWYIRNTLQWNKDRRQTEKGTTYVQYNPGKNRIFNFSHRFIRNDDEQVDVSVQWPIGSRWTVRARSNYSLKTERNIETYAGFTYKSCCWGISVFARQRVYLDGRQKNAIYLQLQFTGLGKLGRSPASPLSQSVFYSGLK